MFQDNHWHSVSLSCKISLYFTFHLAVQWMGKTDPHLTCKSFPPHQMQKWVQRSANIFPNQISVLSKKQWGFNISYFLKFNYFYIFINFIITPILIVFYNPTKNIAQNHTPPQTVHETGFNLSCFCFIRRLETSSVSIVKRW
jgi:hypothetical protein